LEKAQLAATCLAAEKEILEQEIRRLAEAREVAERQLDEEKQLAAARLATAEAAIAAALTRKLEEEMLELEQENMKVAEATEAAERQLAEEKLLAAARLATAEAAIAAAAKRKWEEDDAMSTQEADEEQSKQKADEEESVLAETLSAAAAAARMVVLALVENIAFLVTGRGEIQDREEEDETCSDDARDDENNDVSKGQNQEATEACGTLEQGVDYEDEDFEDLNEGDMQEVARVDKISSKAQKREVERIHTPDYEIYDDDEMSDTDVDMPLVSVPGSPSKTGRKCKESNLRDIEVDASDGEFSREIEIDSRGETAASAATTLPPTRKGARQSSRLVTSLESSRVGCSQTCLPPTARSQVSTETSQDFSINTQKSITRFYTDSVNGQLISSGRDIDWDLPGKEEDLEKWGFSSSLFPASGVKAFPGVDPVTCAGLGPEVMCDDDHDKEQFGSKDGKDRKDRLHPRYRARINLFLGIHEWPPKAVKGEAPAPPKISPFVAKMFKILQDGQHRNYLYWTREGTAFLIRDPLGFQESVLPLYFHVVPKTRSGIGSVQGFDLPTILKELRDHGFRKVDCTDMDSLEFSHRYFVEGGFDHLYKVKTKRKIDLVDGVLPLVLPRAWTPIPMPGDKVPLNHPLYHMTCPDTAPLSKNAHFSRSSQFEGIARPGTTAARQLPRIKDLDRHKARVQQQLEAATGKGQGSKLLSLLTQTVNDVKNAKVDRSAQRRITMIKRKKLVQEVKKEEVLVGPEYFYPKVGMRVKLSQAGRDNREQLTGSVVGDQSEIGMIIEIEPDARLCQVSWQNEEEEWCCTGFSGKYYLQAFIVSEDTESSKDGQLWIKAAKFSPKVDFNEVEGIWRMNRLKSHLDMSTQELRREASRDKLLKGIREEVRKYHVRLRQDETKRLEAEKMAKKQQTRKKRSKRPIVSTVDTAEPIINNIEHVGKFMQRWRGKLTKVIEAGKLSTLALVLRNAFLDMDKLPSGHVSTEHLRLQMSHMMIEKEEQVIRNVLPHCQDPSKDFVTYDQYLDIMYAIFSVPDPRSESLGKPRISRSNSFNSLRANLQKVAITASRTASAESSRSSVQSPLPQSPPKSPCADEADKGADKGVLPHSNTWGEVDSVTEDALAAVL
jgi:hypothetical protein